MRGDKRSSTVGGRGRGGRGGGGGGGGRFVEGGAAVTKSKVLIRSSGTLLTHPTPPRTDFL